DGNRNLVVTARAVRERVCALYSSSGNQNQIGHATSVQRKLEHAYVVHDLPYTGASRFNQGGISLDIHFVGDLADLKNAIYYGIAVHLQSDAGLRVCPEAGQRRFESIWANGKVRKNIRAGLVGHCGALEAG